jgi:hypothetical protein
MKNNQGMFEQLDIFNDFFKEIIEESMYVKLKEACNIPEGEEIFVSDVEYIPVYYNNNGMKTLRRMMLKHNKLEDYKNLTVDELEATGASWEEFIDYLKSCGAKIVNPKTIY